MAKVLQQNDGIVSFDILTNGKKIKDEVEVMEISIRMEVNKITTATILILDGGAIGLSNDDFSNTEGADFVPGNEIEISLGYDNKRATAFKGIILSQNLTFKNGSSQLLITCKDKAVQMTKGRYNSVFQNKKDSEAITSLVSKYSGISSDVDATSISFPTLMQYNCSDWDFVLVRAEMNNLCVITDQNKLKVKKYNFSSAPVAEINATQFVIDIDLTLDSENIAKEFKLTGWDEASQKEVETSVNLIDSLNQGNLSAKKLADVLNIKDSSHYSSALLSNEEMKTWGESLENKAVLSKIQGKINVPGNTEIIAGDLISLSGFSARFNGKAWISKVVHSVQDGTWISTLYVGKSPDWHSSLPDVQETSASGIIPAASGTQIAIVKQIHEDPDGKFRVLINLPVFSGTGQEDGIWARLAFPYASASTGFFFFPEVGDEVLVTFINNDPRHAVITGALYSEKNKPVEIPDEKNQFKSIQTKSEIKIRFDDEDKILTLETPGGNIFTLDDKNKKISITDLSKNSILMEESGITIDSKKDIKINASGKIEISATDSISLKATSDLKAEGMNVQLSAQTGFTAKGNASAELSASGTTTVKGAMVMIN